MLTIFKYYLREAQAECVVVIESCMIDFFISNKSSKACCIYDLLSKQGTEED